MTTLHDLLTVYRLHREPKWPAASKRDQSAIAVAEWVLEHNLDLDRLTAERDEAHHLRSRVRNGFLRLKFEGINLHKPAFI